MTNREWLLNERPDLIPHLIADALHVGFDMSEFPSCVSDTVSAWHGSEHAEDGLKKLYAGFLGE